MEENNREAIVMEPDGVTFCMATKGSKNEHLFIEPCNVRFCRISQSGGGKLVCGTIEKIPRLDLRRLSGGTAMIPEHIIFSVWDGKNNAPPFLSIPDGEQSAIIFENRWEVDSFLKKVRFFQEEAFGNARSKKVSS